MPYYAILLHSNKALNMDYHSLLNENQYKAVSTDKQYVRVVAGAGSGKTRVLTYRLSYLISEKNVNPFSIVAIAFTNKVASEMKSRALSLLNDDSCGLSVSTFHSFCAKFLRKEIGVLDFPNNFTIFDEEDTETLIKNIGVSRGYKKNDEFVKHAINFIGFNKCLGRYPDDIPDREIKGPLDKTALEIFKEYEHKKDKSFSLDFDDLLLKTIIILENFESIRLKWQNRISNILVDEFQDTNDVQYKLLKLLMNNKTSLYVVGDPDQTIYTWRGANQNIIMNFTRDFPSAQTIILDRNYRSTKKILDTANTLISHNKKRVPKNLYTENNEGQDIVCKQFTSAVFEAKYVIEEIERLHNQEHVSYKDIAVLYRAAYLTLPYENEFINKQIPYRIYGGLKFFQRREIKDLIAYFRLLYNEKDDVSFERIVNVPRRSFGESSLSTLKEEKEAHNLSYLEYIKGIDLNYSSILRAKHVGILKNLNDLLEVARERLKLNLEAYPKILEDFVDSIGYIEYLKLDDETSEDRISNVKTLFENINNFLKDNPYSSFSDYLENIALQTSQDEMEDSEQVSLMTIHVAKGLEFKYVFVISLVDGVFPSSRTMDENGADGLEEERRLCYVAFTRAKEKLYVTANTGYSFVLQSHALLSRFFDEAKLKISSGRTASPLLYKKNNAVYNFDDETRDFMDILSKEDDFFDDEIEVPDWQVGDIAFHDAFGEGEVLEVLDGGSIVRVNFYNSGIKSILSSHPKIHKVEKNRGLDA